MVKIDDVTPRLRPFLFLCSLSILFLFLMMDGGKTVMSGQASFPSRESQEEIFSLLFCFLFLLLRVPSTGCGKEGSCYYNTYDFFTGESFSSSLFGAAFFLKHSEGVFYNSGKDWFFGEACERTAKKDILLFYSVSILMCLGGSHARGSSNRVPFVRADPVEIRI